MKMVQLTQGKQQWLLYIECQSNAKKPPLYHLIPPTTYEADLSAIAEVVVSLLFLSPSIASWREPLAHLVMSWGTFPSQPADFP